MSRARESGIFPCSGVAPFETDGELVAALLANDPLAWRAFQSKYDRFIGRCITKVTRRFPWVCPEDVAEIASTLYVSLLANDKRKLRAFDPALGTRFSSWVGLLAINSAYDHLRALAREPPMEGIMAAMDLPADGADPIDLASVRERALLVRQTLDALTERDRVFVALYFSEGMDPRDVAREMNVSIKTIYSKKHKILSRLQSTLATSPS